MREEVRRLTARLESFPTTEEEDEATLRNLTSSRKPGGDGWKMVRASYPVPRFARAGHRRVAG